MASGLSVLVIDDEPGVGVAVERQLAVLGHETHWVGDGAQAIEQVGSGAYDLVLCDLVMPEIDGHEVLREANRRGVTTPFVMMSGRADIVDAVQAQRAGSKDFLIKPFSRRQLERTIERSQTPVPYAPAPTPAGVHERRCELIVQHATRHLQRPPGRAAPVTRVLELLDHRPLTVGHVLAAIGDQPDMRQAVLRRAQLAGANAGNLEESLVALGAMAGLATAAARGLRDRYTSEDPEMSAIELQMWCVHYVSAALVELSADALAWPRPVRMQLMVQLAQLGELEALRAARALWPSEFAVSGPDDEMCGAVLGAAGEVAAAVCDAWDLPRYFSTFAKAWHDPTRPAEGRGGLRRILDLGAWARYRTESTLGIPALGAAQYAAGPGGIVDRVGEMLLERAVERVVVFG